jgi:hypothetical protein
MTTEPRLIPVTTFNLPNGAQKVGYFQRSAEVTDAAFRIIEAGYRFTLERLTTGEISMCVEGEDCDEDIEIAPNAPGAVSKHFDQLVTRFAARVPASAGA